MDPPSWPGIVSAAQALFDSSQELQSKILRDNANSAFLEIQTEAYYNLYEAIEELRFRLRGQDNYKAYSETLDATRKAILQATGPLELLAKAVAELEDPESSANHSTLEQRRIKQRDALLDHKLPNLRAQLEALINVGDSPAAPSTPARNIEIRPSIDRQGGGAAGKSEVG
jgi:hypothetical protein